jgi:hypothetical protein
VSYACICFAILDSRQTIENKAVNCKEAWFESTAGGAFQPKGIVRAEC